jgi:hypothetical protein
MEQQREKKNPLFRAISRLLHRTHDEEPPARADEPRIAQARTPRPEHPRRTEPDVPFDRLARAYTPTQTSLKTSFRATGRDQSRDQEVVFDDRWNDEDRFTNKSGDPRIGTHGRTYEPGERRRK